jgi:hypothetical protein
MMFITDPDGTAKLAGHLVAAFNQAKEPRP